MAAQKRNSTKGTYIPHVEKLHRKRTEPKKREKPLYHNRGEAEVVPAFQIAAILQRWLDLWRLERPLGQHAATHFSSKEKRGADFIGALEYLANESGLHTRKIAGIVREEVNFISLTDADKLLHALSMEHLLSTGEIQVVPNPNWSPERWREYMQERGC